jgi:MFS family permease
MSLLSHRPFLLYFWARAFSEFSYQIAAVAVGWQIYAPTGSAFDLGMVGLVQFIPTAVLVFAAGQVADRYDRKRVAQICQIAAAIAFESPAAVALLPGVVPAGMLQQGSASATAVNYLFVNASYQLGEFESGLTAALLGAMPAVLLGGVGTIAVALLWMKLFPALRQMARLE